MGVLIPMTRPTTPPPMRPPSDGEAEILFFTGVRYYRLDDDGRPISDPHMILRLEEARAHVELRPEHQA